MPINNTAAPLRLERYASLHETAARAFNQRMRTAHAPIDFLLPEEASPPVTNGLDAPITKHQYVLLEGETARGGVIIQEQPHWVAGETRTVWNVQSPLSEGIADRKYGFVAPFLMKELLRRHPLIYSVGMGSASMPFPRLLKALRWRLTEVPFFFRVCNPRRFLREIRAIRSNTARRLLFDVAAFSGLGGLGIRALHALMSRSPAGGSAAAEQINTFGEWADDVWERAKSDYRLCAVRNQSTLNCLYPTKLDRLMKLQIRLRGRTIGWAVVLTTRLQDHKYFGSLQLGTIVDCLAPPHYAPHVVQAAVSALEDLAVDLIVSNQSHRTWTAAFKRSGFLSGPSNYLFAGAGKLLELAPTSIGDFAHINRGDGDGIVNL